MSETEYSGDTISHKRGPFLWNRRQVAETTEGEEQGLGAAVVDSQSAVGPTSLGIQRFQSHDPPRSSSEVPLMVANSNSQPSLVGLIEREDFGNTKSRQRDRFLRLFKKRVADTTEGEGGLGPAVVNPQPVVELIPSTSSGLQHFQSHDYPRSPSDVPLTVSNLDSQPSSVGLIPSNASPEISQLLAVQVTTEPEAVQHVTLNQSPPGLITNSHNIVVSGGNFTSAHTIINNTFIGGNTNEGGTSNGALFSLKPNSSALFTGRREQLDRLKKHFAPCMHGEPLHRRYFLLHGMGGIGKTQICLKFLEEMSDFLTFSGLMHHLWIQSY